MIFDKDICPCTYMSLLRLSEAVLCKVFCICVHVMCCYINSLTKRACTVNTVEIIVDATCLKLKMETARVTVCG